MNFLSAFILCLLINLTPLTLSLLYGNKKLYLNKSIILLFSIITSIGSFIFMYAGKLIVTLSIPKTGNIFGAVSLSLIGIYHLTEYMKIKNNLAGYDTSYYLETSLKYKKLLESSFYINELNNIKNITLNDCLKFSIEILTNNILIYFSAGITGININLCVFFNFILSLIALYLGYLCINDNIFKFLVKHLNLIDGILLIILGLFEIFF